jgi:hypothetical protein
MGRHVVVGDGGKWDQVRWQKMERGVVQGCAMLRRFLWLGKNRPI